MLDATERKCGIQIIYLMISYCELFQSILVHPPSLFSSLSLSLSLSFLVETLLPFYLPVTLSLLPPPLPHSHLSLFLLPSLSLSLSFFLFPSFSLPLSFSLSLSFYPSLSLFYCFPWTIPSISLYLRSLPTPGRMVEIYSMAVDTRTQKSIQNQKLK